MKTVDKLMALAETFAIARVMTDRHDNKFGDRDTLNERRAALLTALQEALREPYDQQSLELCEACGWKTLIPSDFCLNCVRSIDTSTERVEKSGGNVQVLPVAQPLTDEKIQSIYRHTYNEGHHGRDFENAFARAIEREHGII